MSDNSSETKLEQLEKKRTNMDDADLERNSLEEEISMEEAKATMEEPAKPQGKAVLFSGKGFWDASMRPAVLNMMKKTMIIHAVMGFLILGIFSIYWGSMFERDSRIKNLDMLVVIGDEGPIGDNFREFIQSDFAKPLGGWKVYNESEFAVTAEKNNRTVEQEIHRQLRYQKYWYTFYVKPNASANLAEAIKNNNEDYLVSNSSIISIFETGRDFISVNSYVLPSISKLTTKWISEYSGKTMSAIANGSSSAVANQPISFVAFDFAPFTNPVVAAPAQFGSIYMIILTFFQFSFFSEIYTAIAKTGLRPISFLVYRYCSSVVAFFWLSFFFAMVSLAMQVDFSLAFGRGGWVLYWVITFLTCASVGLMNEIMGMLFIIYMPPLVGFWMLFWVVINVAPVFAALELCPEFFRFGYALPIFNSYQITKVIFFDTWRGELGRSVGVLIAWCVVLSLLHPIVTAFFGIKMKKKMQQQAQEQAQAQAQAQLQKKSQD